MPCNYTEDHFFGSVTVGERGQVVIPAEVRKALGIEAGDHLLVFRHPMASGIVMTKLTSVQEVVGYFQRALETVEARTSHGETANSEETKD